MEHKTYNYFTHTEWDIWNKHLDKRCYVFTYNRPRKANEPRKFDAYQYYWNTNRDSEGIYESEDYRGWILANSSDNEFYVGIRNANILDTDVYTFKSIVEMMDFICDTNNPKILNGTIHIHEFDTDVIQNFGGCGGLALPVTPSFNISQENLNLIHCDDFGRYASNIEVLQGIKRYCEKFLLEKLLSYKDFE